MQAAKSEGRDLLKEIRQCKWSYHQMALLHKRLPKHTALVAVSATLSRVDFVSLCSALDLKPGSFHCIRLSSERPNVRTIVRELTHPLGGYQFPDIKYLFRAPVKSVIYCNTIDLGFRVACYGWSLPCALGSRRLHNVLAIVDVSSSRSFL